MFLFQNGGMRMVGQIGMKIPLILSRWVFATRSHRAQLTFALTCQSASESIIEMTFLPRSTQTSQKEQWPGTCPSKHRRLNSLKRSRCSTVQLCPTWMLKENPRVCGSPLTMNGGMSRNTPSWANTWIWNCRSSTSQASSGTIFLEKISWRSQFLPFFSPWTQSP